MLCGGETAGKSELMMQLLTLFFLRCLISASLAEATIFAASWNSFYIYSIVLNYAVFCTAAGITSGQMLPAVGALQFVETCVSTENWKRFLVLCSQ